MVSGERHLLRSAYSRIESNKGRTELREVTVFDAPAELRVEWKGIRQIIQLKTIVKGRRCKSNKPAPLKTTEDICYLISSREGYATFYMEGIRLHWAIENSLHYVKDVTMKEDSSTIRKGSAAPNMSTIKSIALNILRSDGHANIAAATRKIAHNIRLLKDMIC